MHHEITRVNEVNALGCSTHFVAVEKKLRLGKETFKCV